MNLVEVYNDTVRYFGNGKSGDSVKYMNEELSALSVELEEAGSCDIEVMDADSFDMAIRYLDEGLNPLVLNMASERGPGGGVKKGSRAQEEDLFRRSNAFQTHRRSFYPLGPTEVIYSPQVRIIKNSSYEMIDEKVVSMVACAAIRKPSLTDGRYTPSDYELMKTKIDMIFRTAIKHGHDSLVLGALGCGAFSNPPKIVASIFKSTLLKYKSHFKKIGFAILVVNEKDSKNLHSFSSLF